MGSLLTRFFSRFHTHSCALHVRIPMLGLDSAGKTTLLYRLKMGEKVTSVPTIGFNVESVIIKNLALTIWDVGGQDKIRPLWKFYLENIQGLVFVIDSTDHARIQEAKEELYTILNIDSLIGVPVLILCNKQDASSALNPEDIKKEMNFDVKRNKAMVKGCCAINGKGVAEGFEWLATEIMKKR